MQQQMMKLKRVMWQLDISQREMAEAVIKPNGDPISQGTMAQLVNHGLWPKSLERQALERQITTLLFAEGRTMTTFATCS